MRQQKNEIWSEYDFRKIPLDKVERVGQRTLLYKDIFCVSWLLGRFCNYKCSYCWPYARSNRPDHRPTELVVSTIDEIKRQARVRGFNSFHFSFSGGEPTLHPGYLKVLRHYVSDVVNCNYQSVHMTSNCSPSMKWFSKYIEVTRGLHRISITASYHKEFADAKEFSEKLLFLQENHVRVTINMVMAPEKFAQLWEDALFFHSEGINVTLKPQSNPSATKVVDGYTEEQLLLLKRGMPQRDNVSRRQPIMQVELNDREGGVWFLDQAERFNAFEFNRFKGWECSSGYRSIIIREPDGSVKRSYSCNDEPLGNIATGFRLFDKPRLCITESCVSSADSKIPKRKSGCHLPLWPENLLPLSSEGPSVL